MKPLHEDEWLTAVDRVTGEVFERVEIGHLNDSAVQAEARRLRCAHPGCEVIEDIALT